MPVHSSCVDLSTASVRTRKGYVQSPTAAIGRGGVMSILEAFLRSTTPSFDANRGSTAIAADELRQQPGISSSGSSRSRPPTKVFLERDDDEIAQTATPAPSLLKQLLTSGVDVDESEHSDGDECSPAMAVDSVLTDGFGLDADLQLDDPLSHGIGLLQDDSTHASATVASDDNTLVSADFFVAMRVNN